MNYLPTTDQIQMATNVGLTLITAATVLTIAAIKAYGQVRQQIGELQSLHKANAARLDNTVNAVEQVKAQQVNLALAIPPPATPPSIDVTTPPDVVAAASPHNTKGSDHV